MATKNGRFDYVIAGGGTAGCVLAARLSEDPAVNVLMIEAGPEDRSIWTRIPIGFARCDSWRSSTPRTETGWRQVFMFIVLPPELRPVVKPLKNLEK